MKTQYIYIFLFFLITPSLIFGQQSKKESWWKKNTSISGYVKYLNSNSFQNLDYLAIDNQLHNRINFKLYTNDNITFDLQIRNRIFWGESLKKPYFKDYINHKTDINLSGFLIDKKAILLHSKIDRLSLSYNIGDWEIKVGRQRVNWGKTWAWNVNDIFNAYNFLDFDYEERPGSDAISVLYNYGESSSIQAVYSYGIDLNHSIIALRQQFNYKEYDVQLIAGNYFTDYVFGLGWEGYIKNAGFKGESSLFVPKESDTNVETAVLTTLSLDYFFKNGIMLLGSVLYNSNGISELDEFNVQFFLSESLSARNIMPNTLSFLLQSTLQIDPVSSGSFGIMYMQDFNALALLPSYKYTIRDNWDADITGQLFFGKKDDKFTNIQNGIYLRLRYSY